MSERTPHQIVKLYRTRMQIEEGFRDCKATHYGLGLSQHRTINKKQRNFMPDGRLGYLRSSVYWDSRKTNFSG